MVQELSLLNYNTIYLSVWFSLDGKQLFSISSNGVIKAFKSFSESDWLEKLLGRFTEAQKSPWFIVNGDTDLLSRLQFTRKELAHLKGKEVAFFFYEPLFQRSSESIRVPAFYGIETPVCFPELIWLEKFVENHQHQFSVTASVCDYRLDEYLDKKKAHSKIRIRTWDIFVADLMQNFSAQEFKRDPLFRENGYKFQSKVGKKFICPNFRYEGIRELITAWLFGAGLSAQGHISFFHRHRRDHFLKDLPFDPLTLTEWSTIDAGITAVQKALPLKIDTENDRTFFPHEQGVPDADGFSNRRKEEGFHKWYDDSFLAIVNESRFGVLCGGISEKVITPILYMRPFVVIGGPFTLRYLRELGFETFSDYWDESYDEIVDHKDRAQAVLLLLRNILSKPLADLQVLLQELESILARNRTHFLERLPVQMFDELGKDRSKYSSGLVKDSNLSV